MDTAWEEQGRRELPAGAQHYLTLLVKASTMVGLYTSAWGALIHTLGSTCWGGVMLRKGNLLSPGLPGLKESLDWGMPDQPRAA